MNKLSTENFQILEFDVLPTAAITLTGEQIAQAIEISIKVKDQSRQWQIYLHILALLAFQAWLGEREDSLTVNQEKCTSFQPLLVQEIAAVANLQVGKFKLCLLTTDSLSDDQIVVPRAVIELPEYIPHFYVLIEILEEQETAIISGFLSYEQLIKNQIKANLQPEEDWTYLVPINWFENQPDRLLLYLRCLEPNAITLPSINSQRNQIPARIQTELLALLPKLQSPECELWQILTWEQGIAVLTNYELLNWINNLQQQVDSPTDNYSQQNSLRDLLKLLTQPAINVGRWLRNELDELAQEASWRLLPNLTPLPVMRSPVEEFQIITTQLRQRGLEISSQAQGAYHDLILAKIPLRLYAVTWDIRSESDPYGWTLLLVLATDVKNTLPHDLKLRISDQNSILAEQGISQEQGDAYLFTRIIGSLNEKFLVSVSLANRIELTLPPFTFYH